MKNLLLLILLLGFSVSVMSREDIIVRTAEGSSSLLLSDIKCMRFDGGTMLLDMKDGSAKSWSTGDVDCVSFSHTGNGGTNSVWGTEATVTYRPDGKRIVIESRYCLSVRLYSINGVAVCSRTCCGETVIDMSHLPAGVYILNVKGETYKIVNR